MNQSVTPNPPTEEKIKVLLLDILPHLSSGELGSDTNLFKLLDSINLMTFFSILETEFNVKFEPKELTIESFQSIEAIIQFIVNKQSCFTGRKI